MRLCTTAQRIPLFLMAQDHLFGWIGQSRMTSRSRSSSKRRTQAAKVPHGTEATAWWMLRSLMYRTTSVSPLEKGTSCLVSAIERSSPQILWQTITGTPFLQRESDLRVRFAWKLTALSPPTLDITMDRNPSVHWRWSVSRLPYPSMMPRLLTSDAFRQQSTTLPGACAMSASSMRTPACRRPHRHRGRPHRDRRRRARRRRARALLRRHPRCHRHRRRRRRRLPTRRHHHRRLHRRRPARRRRLRCRRPRARRPRRRLCRLPRPRPPPRRHRSHLEVRPKPRWF